MVNVFAREVTDDLVSLARQLEELVEKHEDKQLRAYFTIVTDDPDAVEPKLKEIADKHNIRKVPLTVFDGAAGPPQYKIAGDADVTILMWERIQVKVNRAYGRDQFDQDAVKQIVADTEKIL